MNRTARLAGEPRAAEALGSILSRGAGIGVSPETAPVRAFTTVQGTGCGTPTVNGLGFGRITQLPVSPGVYRLTLSGEEPN